MSFEEDLVNEINEFRTNPREYAKKINKYVSYFKGKILKIPGSNAGIRTEEGAAAYTEAVDFLSKQEGVEPLEPSKGLGRIADDFLKEVQKVDPSELGDIDIDEIIERYGAFSGNLSRAMDFGGETPELVLINLVVSDGDPSRGQRESLLSTDLKKVGVATGKHDSYRYCTVIVSCTKFTNKVDSNDSGFIGGGTSYTVPQPKKPEHKTNEGQGKTMKPRKIKQKPPEPEPEPQKDDIEDDDIPPEGVKSETRSEKIVVEKGKKKRIIKITRIMEDGSKETETIKEAVSDDED
jgi:hypothetical protein